MAREAVPAPFFLVWCKLPEFYWEKTAHACLTKMADSQQRWPNQRSVCTDANLRSCSHKFMKNKFALGWVKRWKKKAVKVFRVRTVMGRLCWSRACNEATLDDRSWPCDIFMSQKFPHSLPGCFVPFVQTACPAYHMYKDSCSPPPPF